MKIKNLLLLLTFFMLSATQMLTAQDRIYFIDKTVADVRIETVADKNIFYYKMVNGVEVLKKVRTQKVKFILWGDGTETEFANAYSGYSNPGLYLNQRKRGLKIHIFAPLLGHTAISYEQSTRPGNAVEYTLGIIGLGNNYYQGRTILTPDGLRQEVRDDQKGFHVGFGYKMYSKPVIRNGERRYKNLLHGWYLMPKINLGFYSKNEPFSRASTVQLQRKKVRFGNLMLYGGKQIVFAGGILLDWQVGVGMGLDSEDQDDNNSFHYVVSTAKSAVTGGGIRLGLVF